MPFSHVIGHAPVVRLLRQAVSAGRVPQSLLFAGPEGVGKRTVAIALAESVNCPRRRDGDACGVCPTCQRIARGQHGDVTLVDRGDEASIRIRVMRERVLEAVGYRPFEAERRVFIIDPADAMTIEAQDALLKTLEEPPPATIIVLVSAYADTLQPTIQSRCRRLRFSGLADADVARVLTTVHGMEASTARRLAARAAGSVSRALAADAGDVDADRDAALTLVSAARGKGVAARLKAAAGLARHGSDRRDREALSDRLQVVTSLLRDISALRIEGVPLANADLTEDLRPFVGVWDVDRVTRAVGAIAEAEDALGRNASPKLVADWIAVTI
jgi:DNA polymerase-3 subunit delta'